MSFRVNVSALLAYQSCPTDWYYRYVLRRAPRQEAHYFKSGSYWHALMALAGATSLPNAIEASSTLQTELLDTAATDPDVSPDSFDKLRDEVERLTLLLPHVRPGFFIPNTIAIEKPLESVIPPFASDVTVFGKPDRIITLHDKVWHVQYKSVSDRTSIAPFVAAASRSLHELVYAYLICGAHGYSLREYGGTILHIVRKLSRKAIKEHPSDAFIEEFVPISESQVLDALADIQQIAADMQEVLSGSRRLIQNRVADLNRHGNVLSPYWDSRSGHVSIHDDKFYRTLPDDSYEQASDLE